ncbi:MAG: hypothetical protein AAGE90_06980 [Pseudomonadota bacterium]
MGTEINTPGSIQNVHQTNIQDNAPIRQIKNAQVQGRPNVGGQANVARPTDTQLKTAVSKGLWAATGMMVTSMRNKLRLQNFVRTAFNSGNPADKLKMAQNLGALQGRLKNDPASQNKLHNMLFVKGANSGIKTGRFTFLRRGIFSHISRSVNAMHARNMIRTAVIATYAKTGSLDKAQHVKDAMMHSLMSGGSNPSKNPALNDQLKNGINANTQFNKIYLEVMTAHTSEVSSLSAMDPKQIAQQDLSKHFVPAPPPPPPPAPPNGNQNIVHTQGRAMPEVLDPKQQQILNDAHIAKNVIENAIDIDRVTKGDLPAHVLETPGKGDPVNQDHQVRNDKLIAKQMAKNEIDVDKVTRGEEPVEIFDTPGNKNVDDPNRLKTPGGNDAINYEELQEAKKLQEQFEEIEGDEDLAKYIDEGKDIEDQIKGDEALGKKIHRNDVNNADDKRIVNEIVAEELQKKDDIQYANTKGDGEIGELNVDDNESDVSENKPIVNAKGNDNPNDEGIRAKPEETKGQVDSDLKFAQRVFMDDKMEQKKLTPQNPENAGPPDYGDDEDNQVKMAQVDVTRSMKDIDVEPVRYEPPKKG